MFTSHQKGNTPTAHINTTHTNTTHTNTTHLGTTHINTKHINTTHLDTTRVLGTPHNHTTQASTSHRKPGLQQHSDTLQAPRQHNNTRISTATHHKHPDSPAIHHRHPATTRATLHDNTTEGTHDIRQTSIDTRQERRLNNVGQRNAATADLKGTRQTPSAHKNKVTTLHATNVPPQKKKFQPHRKAKRRRHRKQAYSHNGIKATTTTSHTRTRAGKQTTNIRTSHK
jgi:hypothetical protein